MKDTPQVMFWRFVAFVGAALLAVMTIVALCQQNYQLLMIDLPLLLLIIGPLVNVWRIRRAQREAESRR